MPQREGKFHFQNASDFAVTRSVKAISICYVPVEYTSLPAFLMPDEFTLTELQRTYEILLARELEKKAFRTRLLVASLLDPVPRMKSGANRPAQLYRLKRRRQPHLSAHELNGSFGEVISIH